MKMGAEPKKVVWLVGLVAVAGIVYWMGSADSPAPSPSASTARPAATDPAAVAIPAPAGTEKGPKGRRTATGGASIGDFNLKRVDVVDPTKTDPTLRLDLLAKVQGISPEGGVRNIFIREAAPPEPPKPVDVSKVPKVDKLHPNGPTPTPVAAVKPPPPPPPPGPPPAPPINLKYYGYSTKRTDGEKKAFFLDGEEIIVAAEGEIIKKQYKVVKIGVNSVQMEDTGSKSTQTLPLQQDAAPV